MIVALKPGLQLHQKTIDNLMQHRQMLLAKNNSRLLTVSDMVILDTTLNNLSDMLNQIQVLNVLKYIKQLQARLEFWTYHFVELTQPVALAQLVQMITDTIFVLKQLRFSYQQMLKMALLQLDHSKLNYSSKAPMTILDTGVVVNHEYETSQKKALGQQIFRSLSQLQKVFGGSVDTVLKQGLKR